MFSEQNHPDRTLLRGRVEADRVVVPQPLKVLVVEDSALDCELVVQELWNAGFAPEWQRVETEAGFLAGLQAAPDLVISDFQMPRFNGLRALELLQQHGAGIPFILVSGTIGEDTAVAAMRQGVTDYLLKDRLARLGAAVTRALGEARLRRERQRMEQTQADHAVFISEVLDSLTSAVVVLDELGNITATNEPWRRFGRENGGGDYADWNYLTVCDTSVEKFGHADAQTAADGIRRVLAGSVGEFSLEYPCHSPTQRRWFLMHVSPLSETKRGVVVAHENITARKLAEETLQRQKTELRVLFDYLPAMIYFKSTDNIILRANQRFADTVGKTVAEIEGRSVLETFPDKSANYFVTDTEVIRSGEPRLGLLETMRDQKGREISIQTDRVPVRDSEGKVGGLIIMSEDITERMRAAEAQRLSEERFRLLANATSDAIWDWDLAANTLWWNDGIEKLFGYPLAALDPSLKSWTDHIHPDELARVTGSIHHAIENGDASWAGEYRFRCQNGRYAEVADRGNIIRDSAGRATRMIGGMTDQTERNRAAAQLLASQQRLALAAESAHIGIWDWDVVANKMVWDVQMYALYGIRREDFSGAYDAWQKGLHPEDRTRSEAAIVAALVGPTGFHIEFRVRWPSGEVRNIEAHAEVTRAADGSALHMIGVNWDVTERRRTEDALRQRENLLRIAGTTARLGGWALDLATAHLTWSDEVCAIHEVPSQTVIALQSAIDFYVPESRASIRAAFAGCAERGTPYDLELVIVSAKGRRVWVRTIGAAQRNAAGEILRVQGSLQDITDRKHAEIALQDSEENFRRLIENSSDVIAVVNGGGVIQYQSPSTLRILGYQPEEVIGQAVTSFIHPEDRGKAVQGIQRALSDVLISVPVEYRIRHRDGTWRIFQSIGRSMGEASGGKVVVMNSRDVTDMHKLELQFLRAQRLEAIGTLSSGIAHDLNNILAPMLMIVPMLREKARDPQDTELLTMIEQGALRGANIIKQLLTFSRGVEGERGPVQVGHLLKEMVGLIRETFPRDLKIGENIPLNLWPVNADATQIHQVLLNLCVNARDAMPAGGKISLSAENVILDEAATAPHPAAKPGSFVRLTIADTGEGISRENLDRIFEPFFTTKEVGQGTGLGLSTVLGIVKSHGGFVTVYSEPGLGTTFNIHLPAIAGAITTVAGAATRSQSGQRELILVVDDEAPIRRSLGLALEKENYRVVVAADGREALLLFQANQENLRLLLTDLMMPVMDGVTLIRLLRAQAPHLCVIAASGLHDEQRRAELTALKVTSILTKPFRTEEVLAAVRRELAAGARGD